MGLDGPPQPQDEKGTPHECEVPLDVTHESGRLAKELLGSADALLNQGAP